MMRKKMWAVCIAIFAVVLMSFAGAAQAKPLIISIAAGGTGGTYYPMSAAIAEIISKEVKGVKNATAQVTGASFENVRLLQKGYCQFALTNAASVYAGFNAEKPFKKKLDKLRTIAWGHGSDLHLITLKDSGIKTIDDVKGKRFAVGSPGSGSEIEIRRLLETNGMSYKDFKAEFLSFTGAVNALKDGRIDLGNVNAGIPVASVMDLMTTKDVHILQIPEAWRKNLIDKYPYYDRFTIPAGTYKGIEKDINTLTSPATFSCSADVPEEVVYAVVKAIHAKMPWLTENIHQSFKRWNFDPSIKRLAPLHPGVIKFYKEIGKMK
jgi:TRAP transporter TAXI family solute receptor